MRLKHIIAFIAVLAMSAGCKNSSEPPQKETIPTQKETTTLKPESPQKILAPTADKLEESQDFEKWSGNYSGNIPFKGSINGSIVRINLTADTTYSIVMAPKDSVSEPVKYKGKFNWENDNIIKLKAKDTLLLFKVNEGMIKQVDKNGKIIKVPNSKKQSMLLKN